VTRPSSYLPAGDQLEELRDAVAAGAGLEPGHARPHRAVVVPRLPLDVVGEPVEHRGDVSAPERLVDLLHRLDVAHLASIDRDDSPRRKS